MHVWGSPGDLDAVARRLDAMAARLVDTGYQLHQQAAQALWTGAGADAFRSRIDGRVRQFEQVGRSIGDAAHEVRAHAATIRVEEAVADSILGGIMSGLSTLAGLF